MWRYHLSNVFAVVIRVCQGYVLAHTQFSTCVDWILGKTSERLSCGTSFGNVKISDHDFVGDAVNFTDMQGILIGALQALNKEFELMGFQVSWVKTKIQTFNDILDAALFFVPVCSEDVEVGEIRLLWQ